MLKADAQHFGVTRRVGYIVSDNLLEGEVLPGQVHWNAVEALQQWQIDLQVCTVMYGQACCAVLIASTYVTAPMGGARSAQ